jgi:hypothetical protein
VTERTAQQFMQGLQALPLDPGARAGLVDLMRQFAGARIRIPDMARAQRIGEAARLLDLGRDRAAICRRLAHLFGVSQRTARRDVAAALDERRPRPARG